MGKPASQKKQQARLTQAVSASPARRPKAAPSKPKHLPPYKVLLHNDDVNEMGYVVQVIRRLTPLSLPEAVDRMLEAHHKGVSLLLTIHKELAELYAEQFASYGLTVTIEPA
jgi:ATP-dependent Clp protease adaptor protein ClpS